MGLTIEKFLFAETSRRAVGRHSASYSVGTAVSVHARSGLDADH